MTIFSISFVKTVKERSSWKTLYTKAESMQTAIAKAIKKAPKGYKIDSVSVLSSDAFWVD